MRGFLLFITRLLGNAKAAARNKAHIHAYKYGRKAVKAFRPYVNGIVFCLTTRLRRAFVHIAKVIRWLSLLQARRCSTLKAALLLRRQGP